MQPEQQLQELKTRLAEISDIRSATAVLGWDQQTYMPPGGAEGRGHQVATLQQIAHTKFVSDEIGKLLDDLDSSARQPGSIGISILKHVQERADNDPEIETE